MSRSAARVLRFKAVMGVLRFGGKTLLGLCLAWGSPIGPELFSAPPEERERERCETVLPTILQQILSGTPLTLDRLETRLSLEQYLTQFFGSDTKYSSLSLLDQHREALRIRNQARRRLPVAHLEIPRLIYAPTPRVQQLLNRIKKAHENQHHHFFYIRREKAFWIQQLGENAYTNFFSGERINFLRRSDIPALERAETLFRWLQEEREKRESSSEREKIAQTMVDLIFSLAFNHPSVVARLRSNEILDQLEALRETLIHFDTWNLHLGYKKDFNQMMRELGVAGPTGTGGIANFLEEIKNSKREILSAPVLASGPSAKFLVRAMSPEEILCRSRVGGDCSSKYWPAEGLHPSYEFFTLTDHEGYSQGFIAVALGSARTHDRRSVQRVAILNKIQGIHNHLTPAIEAVRQILAKADYRLAVPVDLGPREFGGPGLSNFPSIMDEVESLPTDPLVLFGFTRENPKPFPFSEDSHYDRAAQGLSVRFLLPITLDKFSLKFLKIR